MMHDELVKRCRDCIDCLCGECKYEHLQKPGNFVPCMNALLGETADAIEELSAKVESLQFFADNISKLPDCNTCLKKNLCEFMPKYGEYCRINCPVWLGEPEPPKEDE